VVTQRVDEAAWAVKAQPTDLQLFNRALAAGLVATAVYVLLPTDPVWLRELIMYSIVEAAAVVAVVYGVHRYRPSAPLAWLLIGGGVAAFLVGDVIWSVYETVGRDPFPSVGDFFYLAGYPLIAGGLVVAVLRRRSFGVDRRAWIDAGILTVVFGLVAWVYLIQPVFDDPDLAAFEAFVTAAYPVGDLLLLAIAARFVMGSSWDTPALRLLVTGLAVTLAGDVLFALSVVEEAIADRLFNALLLVGVV
jgi:hypothetical protein